MIMHCEVSAVNDDEPHQVSAFYPEMHPLTVTEVLSWLSADAMTL